MDLPNVNEWKIKPDQFAPVTAPDYRDFNASASKPVSDMHQLPSEDSRYPWFSAIMNDSRYVTDYRNKCSRNIPVGYQLSTREWMTHNAEKIIETSRIRMAERTGYADIYKVPRPDEAYATNCDPYSCTRNKISDTRWAIGDARPNIAPELFGTFIVSPSIQQQLGHKNIKTTVNYEGGRNTPSRMRVLQ
jgi:hypothetical protein